MTIGDDDSCTAAPQPATMTRFPSPRSSTTPSPSPSSGSRWFQRTNALLMTDGDDDSPCSETDCVPSQELRAIACNPTDYRYYCRTSPVHQAISQIVRHLQ